jgi:hypothetical protein
MRKYLVWASAAALSAIVGCGQSSSGDDGKGGLTTFRGTVTSTSVDRDNARAIAVADDNTMYWSYLDNRGDFTLKLPVGQSYRIIFANQLEDGGQTKIGHLAISTSSGVSEWIGANEPGIINLGKVAVVKDAAGGGLSPQCAYCSGGGGAGGWGEGDDDDDDDGDDDADEDREHEDDHECTKDDSKTGKGGGETKPKPAPVPGAGGGDDDDDDDDDDADKGGKGGDGKACDVCKKHADDELKPSKNPGDKCADKDKDKESHKAKSKDDDKPCKKGKAGGGDDDGDDKDDKDDEGDDDDGGKGGAEGGKGGGTGGGGGAGTGGGEGGKGGKGGKAGGQSGGGGAGTGCKVSSACSSDCSCVATKCEAY